MQPKTKFSGWNQDFNDAWIEKKKKNPARKRVLKQENYAWHMMHIAKILQCRILCAVDCSWPCLHVQDYMIFGHNWIKKLGFWILFHQCLWLTYFPVRTMYDWMSFQTRLGTKYECRKSVFNAVTEIASNSSSKSGFWMVLDCPNHMSQTMRKQIFKT